MNPAKLIVLFLLVCYIHGSAQVMNVRKWRKAEKDSLDNAMFLIEENEYLKALPIFDELLLHHPKEEFLRYTYAKCALYRGDKHEDAYTYLTELYGKNKKVPDIQYDAALASHYNYKFDEATEYLNKFLANKRLKPEERMKGMMLERYVANARVLYNSPTKAKLKNLGPTINSAEEEYIPAITADESKMIFTYAGAKSVGGRQNQYLQPDPYGEYFEDIFISNKQGSSFAAPMPIESLNSNLPDAVVSLSHDGTMLYTFQDLGDGHGDLWQSHLSGEAYSKPEKIIGEINSYSWDGHCSLSPDGRTFYFSSERAGGFGGKDLYKASLLPDSTWGNIVNLGDSVNTVWDEDAPFIHADGKTLYFSSKGHNSMGSYDVFRSKMNGSDTTFKNCENLGYPINSPADDIYFVVSADSKRGYYSAARKEGSGRSDLYLIETSFPDNMSPVVLVKGKTTDSKKPVASSIKVEMTTANNKIYKSFSSNSSTGDYILVLPAGADYRINYSYPGKDVVTFTVPASHLVGYLEKTNNLDFTPEVPAILASVTPTVPPVKALASTTKSVATTPTVALATKEKTIVPTPTIAAVAPAGRDLNPDQRVSKPIVVVREEAFPKTGMQEKAMRFVEKYGQISDPYLVFKVQVAAVKNAANVTFPNQAQLGKAEKLALADGITRITVGGSFKTIQDAFEHNRKVVKAGQKEGFIIALYKGERVPYDYLEEIKVFK